MKNLIRLRSFILTMLVLSVAFVGCKKDNTEINPTPSGSSVEGTWQMTGMKVSPAVDLGTGKTYSDFFDILSEIPEGKQAVTCLKDTKITFVKGGKVTAVASAACQSADDSGLGVENNSTWKVQGSKIVLTDTEGTTEYDLSVSASTMSWSQVADEDFDGDGKNTRYTYTLTFRR